MGAKAYESELKVSLNAKQYNKELKETEKNTNSFVKGIKESSNMGLNKFTGAIN
jgi:hypothetical protein